MVVDRVLGERPTSRQWAGLLLGLTGVALVVGLLARGSRRLGLPIVTHIAFNATGLVLAW